MESLQNIYQFCFIQKKFFLKKIHFLEHVEHPLHFGTKLDTTSITGPETSDTLATEVANQKAVEALQFLLRKLPNKFVVKDDTINTIPTIDDETLLDPKIAIAHLKQYDIPNDPIHIPDFKPIKPAITSTYTFQVGPIESVTRHTIGENNSGFTSITGPQSKLILPNPVPKYTLPNADLIPPPFPYPSKHLNNEISNIQIETHNQAINTQPLDLYHTMTLKNGANVAVPETVVYLPPHPHQKTSQFEIQKSIQYQLH